MATGYRGTILRVDLGSGAITREQPGDAFYRTYMGGGAFGAYYLLKETGADTDALAPENVLTIAPSVTTGARVSGASRLSVVALSPLTGAAGEGQAGGSFGPFLKRSGYDAVVVTGRAAAPSYLWIDGETVELREAGELVGRGVDEAHAWFTERHGKKNLSVIQCGPAGERLVRFASLAVDRNDMVGRTGMGAVFGAKNLRAVVVRGASEIPFADPDKLKELNRRAAKRLPDMGFQTILKKYGTAGVVKPQAEGGNLATHNFSRSWHPEYERLDGSSFEPEIGAGGTTCLGCVISCRKRVRVSGQYEVSDRLGGPEFETLGLLGSNLDITDPRVVAKANERCNDLGMDTITTGGMAAWLFESLERGLIPADAVDGRALGFGDADGLLWLIEQIGAREGIGDLLAEGFEAAIARFGEATRPYAVQVKGQALAVHMAQVKPSQALMYAVSPIGADHQSCEHDWLMGSDGEDRKGLAIIGEGDAASVNLAKVRMIVYSQAYYSLLDTLTLCMFVWGPGAMFTYQELEELMEACTGWKATLWELMKVGERRVNMLRLVNARRGFDRGRDVLPARLSEPLPDGPAEGRRVDPTAFAAMQDAYYGMVGWDLDTGNPTHGKVLELGLDWTT